MQLPKVQGQLIAINPNNGALEAVVGGYDFHHSKFNRATQGWRQPGSTIKPFVYALALERGMTPYTMISDAPLRIGKWSPRNSDGRYLGMIPLRRALYLSRNTVSVRILQNVGIERARQFFMDIGLHDEQIPRNYTIALGTPQVLPVQMAVGYAAFANGGFRVQPYFIERIDNELDKPIFIANPAYACIPCALEQHNDELINTTQDPNTLATESSATANKPSDVVQHPTVVSGQYRQAQRILKSSSAFDMANILRDVIQHGTGRAALKLGRSDLGGKTGTTNDAKDAWFAGFNGDLVTITWVGFDTPSTLGRREYGGVAALPIWIDFMGKALQDKPLSWVKLDTKGDKTVNGLLEVSDEDGLDEKRQQRETPPLARPLYRPSVTLPVAKRESDFSDLPGEEILIPEESAPPKINTQPKPKSTTPLPESNADPNTIF